MYFPSSSRAEYHDTSSVTRPSADAAVRRLDEAVLVDAGERRERRDEADVRTFRRLDRADAAVVRRVNVADLEARALAREAAGPERAERRRLCVTSLSGLVWSMNCESCELPKYSFTTALTGFALMRSCGISVSISCDMLMRSLMARSMRTRPMRY